MVSMTRSTAATMMMVLAALALMIPTSALADPPEQTGVVERAPYLSAWLFSGDGVIVVTGPALDVGCPAGLPEFGEGFPEPTATFVHTPRGDTLIRVVHTSEVRVFDNAGISDALDWLFGYACPRVLSGEAGPEPLASGEGRVRVNSRVNADGVELGTVGVNARVTTADGRRVHLDAHGRIGPTLDDVNYGG